MPTAKPDSRGEQRASLHDPKRPALGRDQEPSVGREGQRRGGADGRDQVVAEAGREGDGGGGEGEQGRKDGQEQSPAVDP